MVFVDCNTEKKVTAFLAGKPRHKFVVVCSDALSADVQSVNIGYELAAAIRSGAPEDVASESLRYLREIFAEGHRSDELLGDYINLCNIGILFEPALQLDVAGILSRLSQRYVVLLSFSGTYSYPYLYFSTADSKNVIGLGQITHILI